MSSPVSIGVGLFPTEDPNRLRTLTQLAESLGYASAWFGDSQNIWREAYVTIGACAVGTSTITLGTGVTNPVTRHTSVLASAWATLAELTGNRAICGIGTGDSSLRTMGLKPMKLAELEAAIGELRELWRTGAVVEQTAGESFHLSYLGAPTTIPVYVAASAPKIIRLAGRIADGVILLVGTDPGRIGAALAELSAGAAEAGRRREDIDVVLWTPTAIDDDEDRARDLVRAHVARIIVRPLPAPIDEHADTISKVRAAYDYYQHMDPHADHGDRITPELVDMFALAGNTGHCAGKVAELLTSGVDQIAIVPFVEPGQDRAATIERFAEIHASAARGR